MERRLRRLGSEWDRLAERDAFHAVLSETPEGGWTADEFYATGPPTVASVFDFAAENGVTIPRGRALDFGCGAGRVSFALADRFEHVVGVDLSPAMIEKARAAGVPANCELIVEDDPSLPALDGGDGFDLVFTMLVIQHMHPRLGRAYLPTLARLVAPGGVLFCQIPYAYARDPADEPAGPTQALFRRLAPTPLITLRRRAAYARLIARQRRAGQPAFELHTIPRRDVSDILVAAGLEIVRMNDGDAWIAPPLLSAWYLARRAS